MEEGPQRRGGQTTGFLQPPATAGRETKIKFRTPPATAGRETKVKFRKPPETAGQKRKRRVEEDPQRRISQRRNLPIQEDFAMKSLRVMQKQAEAQFKMKA